MPIVQDAFDIPVDIALGIATGKFQRIGSVVRVAEGVEKGQIVKHLQPVILNNSAAGKVAKGSVNLLKRNKKVMIIAGAAVIVIAGGAAVYKVLKNRQTKELKAVHNKLDNYISAIRNGKVDFLVVDELAKALDELRDKRNYEKMTFQLSAEELAVIVGHIYTYTRKLVKDNEYVITPEEKIYLEKSDDAIFDLRNYLELQKKVIVNAA